MFEKAVRTKLRIKSDRGLLSVEDVWDLSLQELNKMAKSLNKEMKEQAEEDFLEETGTEDLKTKLRFEIVLYVLKTKKAEKESLENEVARKAKKEKLLNILDKKLDAETEEMSIDDIRKEIDSL